LPGLTRSFKKDESTFLKDGPSFMSFHMLI